MKLTAYWFRTDIELGYGVTAQNQQEAEHLLQEYGYPKSGQKIQSIEAIEGTNQLEQSHVAPNAGPLIVRGIWFPKHNV